MDRKTDGNVHEVQSLDVTISDFSNDELLEELGRRLHSASEELKLLRAFQTATSEKGATETFDRHMPETADGLLATINVGPRAGDDGTGWDSPDPYASPKILRKKAIVKLARAWTRMALDPSRLRNGEINRRLMEREAGVPRNTMRPYLDAGLELHGAGRLYLDDDPSEMDIAIVEKSMGGG